MSESPFSNVFIAGLRKFLSYQERKERLFLKLSDIKCSNEQSNVILENLHPPPDPRTDLINIIQDQSNLESVDNDLNFTSIYSLRDVMLEELERLRRIMRGDHIEDDENYHSLSQKEKQLFHNFLDYFAHCPVCKRRNHNTYLKTFYFDESIKKRDFKERLLKLMDESKDFNDIYYNKILFGIPCCECFKKFFLCEF